jgi:RNA polymerase sigma-70 factor (ECF subfamily)
VPVFSGGTDFQLGNAGSKAPAGQAEKEAPPKTFEEVVERYTDLVYNVAYSYMGNPHDAEDIVQDAFLSAYRTWDRFRGESRVTTWLYRIATNAALMKIRKGKRGRELTQTGLDDIDIPRKGMSPEQGAANAELGAKLNERIAMLEPNLRTAVVLRDVQDMSNTEAAEILEITVSSLKSRLHRGRLLLRKHLSDYVATREN